jgi:hypothetical protein
MGEPLATPIDVARRKWGGMALPLDAPHTRALEQDDLHRYLPVKLRILAATSSARDHTIQ